MPTEQIAGIPVVTPGTGEFENMARMLGVEPDEDTTREDLKGQAIGVATATPEGEEMEREEVTFSATVTPVVEAIRKIENEITVGSVENEKNELEKISDIDLSHLE